MLAMRNERRDTSNLFLILLLFRLSLDADTNFAIRNSYLTTLNIIDT